ncbi:MAG: hypothetical protein JKX81_01615 [Arenicella sp.]|nr:hypothetical protein [Arenicella sp.]
MSNIKVALLLLLSLLSGLSSTSGIATELSAQTGAQLPQFAPQKHMGVATCGNSTCHSVKQLEEPSNVLQNEYRTWLFHDRHSKAYTTLLSEESQRIASKLGIKEAANSSVCLDCHADNVPIEQRGEEFHMTDGVGCEACHGGSENWLGRHTIKPYSLQRNLDDGMYPSANLAERTKLCVSCHVGSEKKLANHNIMGAGHPRLGFELDTFTIRQPEHYIVDEDYRQRKNPDSPVRRLLVGSAVHAQSVAKNLGGSLINNPQGHPEIALYDCHSCHHSLSDLKWKQRPSTAGLKPGAIRLNDSSFILLAALTGALDSTLQDDMLRAVKALHSASSKSIRELQLAAGELQVLALTSQRMFENIALTEADKRKMIEDLMWLGVRGEYRDYISAEQAVMAMDALSYSLPEEPSLTEVINRAYQYTQNDEAYKSEKFRQDLEAYLKLK